jgi:hypothetical protein
MAAKTNVAGATRSCRKPPRSYCTDRNSALPNCRNQTSVFPDGSNVTLSG